jgi:Tol biopolymer transport system component
LLKALKVPSAAHAMKDAKVIVAAKLFGGQGTINVPSWSPDGKRFAFVSYALVPGE